MMKGRGYWKSWKTMSIYWRAAIALEADGIAGSHPIPQIKVPYYLCGVSNNPLP